MVQSLQRFDKPTMRGLQMPARSTKQVRSTTGGIRVWAQPSSAWGQEDFAYGFPAFQLAVSFSRFSQGQGKTDVQF